MSVSLGANGSNYNYPETGELSWGANATNFASAVSAALAKLGLGATLTDTAVINISSTTKGVLIPSMTTTQRDAISTPATGLIIYNTTSNRLNFYFSGSWRELVTNGVLTASRIVITDSNGNYTTTNAIFIDGSSNVGIGIQTPASRLHVVGLTHNDSGIIVDQNAATGGGYLVVSRNGSNIGVVGVDGAIQGGLSDNLAIFAQTSSVIKFYTNGSATQKMILTTGGNLGLGNITPSYQLELSTDSAGKPSTNVWTTTSDERIKENITLADLDRCYEIVKNLPLKKYAWKYYNTNQAPDQNMLGWIAQDVQQYFPKAVNVSKFVIKEEIKDGEIVTQEEEAINDCLNLNSDQINKVLYGAVQKLQAIVETQQAKILELENRINTLEGN